MPKLICMSFDGEYKTERPTFETVEAAWNYSNGLGSKWYFYPFHFVVTDSGKTILDAPDLLEWATGRRTATVAKMFSRAAEDPEAHNMDCEYFTVFLWNKYAGPKGRN